MPSTFDATWQAAAQSAGPRQIARPRWSRRLRIAVEWAVAATILIGLGTWLYATLRDPYQLTGPARVTDAQGRSTRLADGAWIETDAAPATLKIRGHSTVVVAPGTRLRVDGSAQPYRLWVERGEVKIDTRPASAGLEVASAVGQATGRGERAQFSVNIIEGDTMNRRMSVAVLSGLVMLVSASSQQVLAAGDGATLAPPVAVGVLASQPATLSKDVAAAVDKGLAALFMFKEDDKNDVAFSAASGLALLAQGSRPGQGQYAKELTALIDKHLLPRQDAKTGLIHMPVASGPMYGHGLALLFLSEALIASRADGDAGKEMTAKLEKAVAAAVRLMLAAQNKAGGWRYTPAPNDADVSCSNMQLVALAAARRAGVRVPEATIRAALRYLTSCQNVDGGFRYVAQNGAPTIGCTTGAIASFASFGKPDAPEVIDALAYLMPNGGPSRVNLRQASFYFYAQLYMAIGMNQIGGKPRAEWYRLASQELLASQAASGRWKSVNQMDQLDTAIALMVLQSPLGHLSWRPAATTQPAK